MIQDKAGIKAMKQLVTTILALIPNATNKQLAQARSRLDGISETQHDLEFAIYTEQEKREDDKRLNDVKKILSGN